MEPSDEKQIEQLTPLGDTPPEPSSTKAPTPKVRSNLVRVLPLLILSFGLLAGLVLVRYSAEIRNLAFTGYQANLSNLAGLKLDPNPIPANNPEPENSARRLFNSLSRTYFDAQVQNVNVTEFGIKGVVFSKYDSEINKTFIFSRLENMPLVEGRLEQMWMVNGNLDYIPAGLGETYVEDGVRATYNVFVSDGDITVSYKQVLYSYDASVAGVTPLSPVLSVDF